MKNISKKIKLQNLKIRKSIYLKLVSKPFGVKYQINNGTNTVQITMYTMRQLGQYL
jgi:hypothetical protein